MVSLVTGDLNAFRVCVDRKVIRIAGDYLLRINVSVTFSVISLSLADSVGIDFDDFLDEHRGFELELASPVPSSDFLKHSVKVRLSKSMEFWQSIGALDFILDVIKEGYKIPFISTPPPKHYSNNAPRLGKQISWTRPLRNFWLTIVLRNRNGGGVIHESLVYQQS